MPKVYFATVSQEVAFDRVCSNCDRTWTTRGTASSGSHMEQTKPAALETAQLVLSAEKKDWRDNRDVLCPHCSHFSKDAMDLHFRKGYAAAIIRNFKRAAWCDFLAFVCLGWLPVVLFIFANLIPWQSDKPILSTIFLLLFLIFGSVSVIGLTLFVWARFALSSVRRKLERLSDEALLELAIDCYKSNKNSVYVDIDPDAGLLNAWLKKPLFYKVNAAPSARLASG